MGGGHIEHSYHMLDSQVSIKSKARHLHQSSPNLTDDHSLRTQVTKHFYHHHPQPLGDNSLHTGLVAWFWVPPDPWRAMIVRRASPTRPLGRRRRLRGARWIGGIGLEQTLPSAGHLCFNVKGLNHFGGDQRIPIWESCVCFLHDETELGPV